jgi:DNA-dependent RNA polymerase auxiliary subunit epsilon
MNPEKIKNEARTFHQSGDYPSAYSKLWELGSEEFYSYTGKTKDRAAMWLYEGEGATYFWEKFIYQENVFRELLQGSQGIDLLHKYFTRIGKPAPQLLSRLMEASPVMLLKVIRANRVFLNREWYDILLSLPWREEYRPHLLLWKFMIEAQESSLRYIDQQTEELKNVNITNVLGNVTIWLEQERFRIGNSKTTLHHLARTYNFFVENVLADVVGKMDKVQLNVAAMEMRFEPLSKQRAAEVSKSTLGELLQAISAWVTFNEDWIELYCFDMDFTPVVRNGTLYLEGTAERHYRWKVDEVRYEVNTLNYLNKGDDFLEYLEKTGKTVIPKGRTPGMKK